MNDIVNVKQFGAKGDGETDDTDAINTAIVEIYGSYSDINQRNENRKLFFPAGIYKTSEPIVITALNGGFVGAGKYATVIKCVEPGVVTFWGNGWSNGLLQDMCFQSAGGVGSRCFEWARKGANNPVNQAGLSVRNCAFVDAEDCVRLGTGTDGSIGVNDQSSETVWTGCDFRNAMRCGLAGGNGNCLNHNFIGCNFDSCGRAGLGAGPISYPLIEDCRFTNIGAPLPNYEGWEDYVRYAIIFDGNSTSIVGCHISSSNFLNYNTSSVHIIACLHDGPEGVLPSGFDGNFLEMGSGTALIEGCSSTNGKVRKGGGGGNATIYARGNKFRPTAFDSFAGTGARIAENI